MVVVVVGGLYLPCQVKSGGLGKGAVDLTEHPAQLSHHGAKVVQEGSDGLFKHRAHCLVGRGGGGGKGEGWKGGSWLVKESSEAETSSNKRAALPLYLHHLRVLEPPAEEPLDQGEHLLQHNHHLKRNQDVSHTVSTDEPSRKHSRDTYRILRALGGGDGLAGRSLTAVRVSVDVQSGEKAGQHPQDVDDGLFGGGTRLSGTR